MTRSDAKARFQTVASAEEMADLMLDCFRAFGADETERLIIEIKEDQTGVPFLKI